MTENDELATLLIRFERAQSFEEIRQILTELDTALPSSKSLPLHRAFISWLGGIVLKQTETGDNILHDTTIQEACSMLADIAPHWEQSFIKKGRNEEISIGRSEGISIGETLDGISEMDTLKKLISLLGQFTPSLPHVAGAHKQITFQGSYSSTCRILCPSLTDWEEMEDTLLMAASSIY